MQLTTADAAQLKKIISIAQTLLEKAGEKGAKGARAAGVAHTRIRRSGKDLSAFRKMLKAERKAGVPVADLAKKHGISPSYIYQLG
ncbi:hypothetical protein AMST5_00627 [freshwater sediment metagenome]|jgi:hypothetical protein|uniref:Uncharacterized protein n=1 Tax=freshwater sediment metagenome TaxID=556182 RepID=A0AA48M0N5_9ZZZZ